VSTFADQLECWSGRTPSARQISMQAAAVGDSSASESKCSRSADGLRDNSRDADVDAVVPTARRHRDAGDQTAVAGGSLRAGVFSACAHHTRRPNPSSRAWTSIRSAPTPSVFACCRCEVHVLRVLGQDDASLPFLERALDLANKMHDELRTLHATLRLPAFTRTAAISIGPRCC